MVKQRNVVGLLLLLISYSGVADSATRSKELLNKLTSSARQKIKKELTRFVFVVPSYNNSQWYRRNLASIFRQRYEHYRVIYVDDRSPDETSELVEKYVKEVGQQERVTLVRNKNRVKALANIYKAVHMCDDEEVVVMLDGDDWLANDHVLETLANVYINADVWLTFGSFSMYPDGTGWAQNIPTEVVKKNAFRY